MEKKSDVDARCGSAAAFAFVVDAWASRALFSQSHLPDGSANPFLGCLRHDVEGEETVCRRKVCCLRYLLPGIPSCGELCALPAQRKQCQGLQ